MKVDFFLGDGYKIYKNIYVVTLYMYISLIFLMRK